LITSLVALVLITARIRNHVDTSFATEISLKYSYGDKEIAVAITDKSEIELIKDCFGEISYSDSPSCGFSIDISLEFSDDEKSIVICPARDGCSTARIAESGRYIHIKDRKTLEAVLGRYGMVFPCV
jgi:hypothetical protein